MRSALTAVRADAVRAIVERILPHQGEQRRFGQAIGAEIRARINGLLGDVEQQAAAGALRQHDLDRGLRHALVAVEIQLEALAQDVFVDLADAALPGGAGIGDDDIDAAEIFGDASKAARTEAASVTSHSTGNAVAPIALACSRAAAKFTSSKATSAPAAAKASAVAAPMAPAAPVTATIWPCKRRGDARAELLLFERPIFAVEHVGFGDGFEVADGFGIADAFDPGFGDVGGNDRRPSWCGRDRTGRGPAPARRGAGDRAPA